ncbi:MAG: dihydropteroate synthase [Gammaproteobacteria bacterium]
MTLQPIFNCHGKGFDLRKPLVMGIINLMPTSFSPIGRVNNVAEAVAYAKQIVTAGADIIDIGAEPTNAACMESVITEAEELAALLPVIKALTNEIAVPISVDTSRPGVMEAVIAAGAHMINDVRALRVPGALTTAAALQVPICLMHMRFLRLPDSVAVQEESSSTTTNVMDEIVEFLQQRITACEAAGIKRDYLIVDPGIGAAHFGKSLAENLMIVQQLSRLRILQLPILVGISNKLFKGEPTEKRAAKNLSATLTAIKNGANIVRVHDVETTVLAIKGALD